MLSLAVAAAAVLTYVLSNTRSTHLRPEREKSLGENTMNPAKLKLFLSCLYLSIGLLQ